MEITSSAGGLQAGFSEEDFFLGYSVPQNKELMRVFKDLDLVEHMGFGVPRVLEYYPITVYQFTKNFIRVVLPFDKGFKEYSDQVTGQVEGNIQKCLKFCVIARSTKEIMQHLELTHRESFRDTVLLPLLKLGKLLPTILDKPNSPKQKYVAV